MKNRLKEVIERFKSQVDYLEVRVEETSLVNISVKNSLVDSMTNNFIYGGNVRALYKGGWGFVVFKDLNELEAAVKKAVTQAKLVGAGESHWAKVEPVEYSSKLSLKKDPRQVPLKEKIQLLKRYTTFAKKYDKRIVASEGGYKEYFKHTTFANSEGSCIEQETADVYLQVMVTAVTEGDTQNANYTLGNYQDFDVFYDLEDRIEEKCKLALELLAAPRIKGGKYIVILNPKLTGVFVHEAFGHTVEADFIAGNEDMMEVLKPGKIFGSEILNIYDSGVDEGLRGSFAYDDEGTPSEQTYLIKNGKLVGHLHSRETAAKMNAQPTGNARALSFRYPPIPRMRNTAIEGGASSFAEMIKDIKLGVYAIDANGGKGGENFSFTAHHGYMIRDGKLAELVKGFTLAGNLFKTMKDIDMVGNDETLENSGGGCGKDEQVPLPVVTGGPHIRIQNVTIGGEE